MKNPKKPLNSFLLTCYLSLISFITSSQVISFTPHISPHIFPFQKNSDIFINGTPLKGNCDDGNLLSVYNCTNIAISMPFASTVQDPYQYKIDILQYDNNTCSALPNTPSYFNYYGNWTPGPFPNGLDLRTLTNAYGNSFYTHTGMFLIKISFKDANLNIFVKSGLINIQSSVNPYLNLEIYNIYWTNPSNTYLPASQNISNPILTGALSPVFRINNSTGNITGYNVNIDQVDNTGALIKNIYNKTYITNNITTIASQNLNSFCIPSSVWAPYTGINACTSTNPNYSGYTGYWGYNNGQLSVGNYYKITVTLYNPCSNASNYSYIYVNNGGMRLMQNNDDTTGNYKNPFKATIFPNPSDGIINFNILTEKDDYYTIQIFDLTGRLLFTPFDNIFLNKGEHVLSTTPQYLNSGTYLCKILSSKSELKNIIFLYQR